MSNKFHDKLLHVSVNQGGSRLGKKQNSCSKNQRTISNSHNVVIPERQISTINSKTLSNEATPSFHSPQISVTLGRAKEADQEKSTNSLDRASSPEAGSPGLRKSVLKTSKLGV